MIAAACIHHLQAEVLHKAYVGIHGLLISVQKNVCQKAKKARFIIIDLKVRKSQVALPKLALTHH